ncbi:MAG: 16S rRNA (guanine(966)-N(2))-methyltransferase RsmD [Candidatus Omnitrophota bacterium]
MKILTGTLRGKAISFRPNPKLRPTSDKVRKAIFDMLQGGLEDKNVLDLFSGTGAIGFEALSQGAARVTFVEMNKAQCDKIRENLIGLGLADRAQVVNLDAVAAVGSFSRRDDHFDFIFLDPPYEKSLAERALTEISRSSLLDAQGWVILECGRREALPEEAGALKKVKMKRYGDTTVLFYQMGREGG